jgi:hypothetical protein
MTCSWVVVIVAVMGVVVMATVCVAPSCDAGEVIYEKSNRPHVVFFFFFCGGHPVVLQN